MNTILHVYRKEIRDMFRDKRARSAAFIGPFVGVAVMITFLSFITSTVKKQEGQKLYVVQTNNPELALLKKANNVVFVPSAEEGAKLIKKGEAHVVLQFGDPKPDGSSEVDAYFDPKEQLGQLAVGVVEHAYGAQNKAHLHALLAEKGLPTDADEQIKVVRHEVQVGDKGGAGDFLVGFLPYLIVIWAFFGGMSISSDLVAGEKEKNTLETLLISPAQRTQIVIGKFLSLGTLCLSSSLSTVVGLMIASQLHIPGTEEIFKNGFGVTPITFGIILVVLLPLVIFFASLLIAISSFARNPREAQTYLSQFSILVMLPAIFSQVIGLTDAAHAMWVNFVPVLNSANCIRMALLGKTDFASVAVTVAVSLVIGLAALRLTVFLFNREEVLVRV